MPPKTSLWVNKRGQCSGTPTWARHSTPARLRPPTAAEQVTHSTIDTHAPAAHGVRIPREHQDPASHCFWLERCATLASSGRE
jgi:hypothetical protein